MQDVEGISGAAKGTIKFPNDDGIAGAQVLIQGPAGWSAVGTVSGSVPAAPDERDLAAGLVGGKGPRHEAGAAQESRIDGELGERRDAEPVVDHLNERWQARRLESLGAPAIGEMADRERVVA